MKSAPTIAALARHVPLPTDGKQCVCASASEGGTKSGASTATAQFKLAMPDDLLYSGNRIFIRYIEEIFAQKKK